MDISQYPTIYSLLNRDIPDRLFHYTSPAGLIGIAQNKKLWATHVKFLNDSRELSHATDLAKLFVSNQLTAPGFKGKYNEAERKMLEVVADYAGSVSSDIYVACLSEERDLLSQWRAYCPPAGGYSIGISSDQLRNVANEQNYLLYRAVYDQNKQYTIVGEIISTHLNLLKVNPSSEEIKKSAIACSREISKYGTILKHDSFKEEHEWRLISSSPGVNSPHIQYRNGTHSVIPYLKFSLDTPAFPDANRHLRSDSLEVVVGPTRDPSAAQFAVQSLGHNAFPPGWAYSMSATTYRG